MLLSLSYCAVLIPPSLKRDGRGGKIESISRQPPLAVNANTDSIAATEWLSCAFFSPGNNRLRFFPRGGGTQKSEMLLPPFEGETRLDFLFHRGGMFLLFT